MRNNVLMNAESSEKSSGEQQRVRLEKRKMIDEDVTKECAVQQYGLAV